MSDETTVTDFGTLLEGCRRRARRRAAHPHAHHDPPHVLEYDWIELSAPGEAIRDSYVRFELTANGDRVHLTFTQRALPVDDTRRSGRAGTHTSTRWSRRSAAREAPTPMRAMPRSARATRRSARFPPRTPCASNATSPYRSSAPGRISPSPTRSRRWLARGEPATKVGEQFHAYDARQRRRDRGDAHQVGTASSTR